MQRFDACSQLFTKQMIFQFAEIVNTFKHLHTRPAMLKQAFLLGLSFLSLTAVNSPCIAAPTLPATVYSASEDILASLPVPEKFPAEIKAAAQPLEQARKSKSETDAAAKFKTAITQADALIKTLPRGLHDELEFIKAFSFESLGETDKAKASYSKTLAMRANNDIALFRYAHLLLQSGNCQDALPLLYESSWRNEANGPQVNYVIGECLLVLKRDEEALSFFEKSATSAKTFAPPHRRLLEIYDKKLESVAIPEERKLIELKLASSLETIASQDPSDTANAVKFSKYLLRNADPLLGGDNLTRAEKIAASATKNSSFANAEAVRTYVDILMRQKKFDEASKVIEKGLKKNKKSELLIEANKQLAIEKALQSKQSLEQQ